MKKLFILSSLLLLLAAADVQACSCEYRGSFLKLAPPTQLVAVVKVTRYLTFKDIYGEKTPMSMEAEIIDIYKGVEQRKKIIVWGDPGNLCRPYLNTFKEGQYYAIAFDAGRPNTGTEPAGEKATDYSICICGAYWLSVDIEKQIVSGHIKGKEVKTQSMSLSELKVEVDKASVNNNAPLTTPDSAGVQLLTKPELRTLILKETKEGGKLDFFTPIKGKEYDGVQVKPGIFSTNIGMALYKWGRTTVDLGVRSVDDALSIFAEFKGRPLINGKMNTSN